MRRVTFIFVDGASLSIALSQINPDEKAAIVALYNQAMRARDWLIFKGANGEDVYLNMDLVRTVSVSRP